VRSKADGMASFIFPQELILIESKNSNQI